MAIINNNVGNVKFLRNGSLYGTHDAAYAALTGFTLTSEQDGTIILARYGSGNEVKTLAGLVYVNGENKSITIIDIEGASGDVQELREEIEAKLGEGIGSGASETVTAQLTALSGNSSTDTSATTSVAGAKKYADDLISTLDYEDTAVAGQYVSQVTQADGKIAVVRVELPSSADTAVAKKFVTSVAEDKGQIVVSRGEISSSAETMVLTDNADGGVNFEVNIDNDTIVQDETSKKLKVASAALTQYVGDGKTIEISAADANNNKTVSTLLTLSSVTPSSTTVKEEYALKNASGETIGSTIKIYKDSSIVEINYITDPADTHYQNLEYIYIDASGNTQTEYVDMSSLVLEAEFASGVTFSDGVAHGVVDPNSESFLTVGADGFKISGVSGLVTNAIEALDADKSGSTEHVSVRVEEVDGKITAVTVAEDNIANADDLATLSGKTVTAITSTNGSITASIDDAVGNKTYDIVTDASKIKMSGFTSTDVLSGITSSSSITEAFEEVDKVITTNEEITAAALNDLEEKIKEISGSSVSGLTEEIANRQRVDGITGSTYTATSSANYISAATSLNDADQKLDAAIKVVEGDLDVVETNYVSGMTVNGSALTKSDRVLAVTVTPATSATTATSTEAITVATDANGNITLGIATIDCGTY